MIFGSLFSFCSFSAFTLYIMRKICFLILFCRTDLKISLRFFGNSELKVSVDRFFLPAVPEYTMKPLIFHGYPDTPGLPLPFYRNAFSVTTIGYFRAIDAVKKRRDNFHGIRRSHGKPAYIAINPCQNAAPEMMIERENAFDPVFSRQSAVYALVFFETFPKRGLAAIDKIAV